MSVTAFTLCILAAYLVGLKVVSFYAYRASNSTTEDYFLARRGVGVFALVATTMASIFSTGTVVSAPSEFFTKGAGYFWIFFFGFLSVAMMPVVLRFWKLGKVYGYITPAEMLGDFFQSRGVAFFTACIGLLAVIPYAAAQMVAVGKTFEALTSGDVPYEVGVTVACAAIGLYLYFGGARAVIWTDAIQGVVFALLLMTTAILTLYWAGGWNATLGTLAVSAPEKASFSVGLHYFEYIPLCLTFFFLPYVWQRMYMARSAKTVAKNVAILPIVFALLFFITWIIGTAGLSLFPQGLADGDSILGAIFREHAPYFGAFVLVAAFSAGMSTVDSQLLSASSIMTQDLRPFWHTTQLDDLKSDYRFARWTTIIILGVIFAWSLTLKSKSILSLIIMGVSLTAVFAPAVYGMFFWKRSTTAGALSSLIAGLIAFLLAEFTILLSSTGFELSPSSWAFLASSICFVGVSLVTDAKCLDAKRAEYQEALKTPLRSVKQFRKQAKVQLQQAA